MYTYQHFEFPIIALFNLVNTYLTKSLPHINPNLAILGKTCILYNFFPLCWQILSIMLALCSMLLPPYYAQNYAGIIGSSLHMRQLNKINERVDIIILSDACETPSHISLDREIH